MPQRSIKLEEVVDVVKNAHKTFSLDLSRIRLGKAAVRLLAEAIKITQVPLVFVM